MKINVASINETKVNAVKELIQEYPFLKDSDIKGIKTETGVSDQPTNLEESFTGAKNRAKNAFTNCDLSIGTEGGILETPQTKTGMMNISVTAIYDGKEFYYGISSAFEHPQEVINLVKQGKDLNDAYFEAKLTEKTDVGKKEGSVGILTKNRLPRKEYIKQGLMMALTQLEK
tara:strand:+ start:8508 stop:9026 length:519 start_codon:yes stop_codon:yes gene_type:complete